MTDISLKVYNLGKRLMSESYLVLRLTIAVVCHKSELGNCCLVTIFICVATACLYKKYSILFPNFILVV